MRDRSTRKLERPAGEAGFAHFLAKFRASLVAVSGGAEGTEIPLDQRRLTIGRGPGVDWAFESDSLSRQHASIEFGRDGFWIRDLGSTNGVEVNGERVESSALHHGDRCTLGDQGFQMVIEERDSEARTWVVPEV
ncbi:MAG: FHA domain-containing protein [Myxococcota bacterium]